MTATSRELFCPIDPKADAPVGYSAGYPGRYPSMRVTPPDGLVQPSARHAPGAVLMPVGGSVPSGATIGPSESDTILLPTPSWDASTEAIRFWTQTGFEGGIELSTEYYGKVAKAAEQLRGVQRTIIDEYIAKVGTKTPPTEADFRRWYTTWAAGVGNPETELLEIQKDIAGRRRVYSTQIRLFPRARWEELHEQARKLSLMPEGAAKQRELGSAARKLVLGPALDTRRILRVSEETASKLQGLGHVLTVADFIGPGIDLATAKTWEEYRKALAENARATASYLAGTASGIVARAGLALLLASSPAGWVISGVGIVAGIVAGHYAGEFARKTANRIIPLEPPPPIPGEPNPSPGPTPGPEPRP